MGTTATSKKSKTKHFLLAATALVGLFTAQATQAADYKEQGTWLSAAV